jgi:hypothetical protein
VIVTWHSPAEMLPQVGQECWIVLYGDERMAYSATLKASGYGNVAMWNVIPSRGQSTLVEVKANEVKKWCRREEIDATWGDPIKVG